MEVLIFILFIVLAIAGNKGKHDARKRRREARRQQQGGAPSYVPPPTAQEALPDAAFAWPEMGAAYEPPPETGSMAYDSPEGVHTGSRPYSVSSEGMAGGQEGGGLLLPDSRLSAITHVVRPFTEGDHLHTESSLTGDVPCPPSRSLAGHAPAPAAAQHPALGLRLDPPGVRQGILYAEILGKPCALRGRR